MSQRIDGRPWEQDRQQLDELEETALARMHARWERKRISMELGFVSEEQSLRGLLTQADRMMEDGKSIQECTAFLKMYGIPEDEAL